MPTGSHHPLLPVGYEFTPNAPVLVGQPADSVGTSEAPHAIQYSTVQYSCRHRALLEWLVEQLARVHGGCTMGISAALCSR